MVSNLSFSVNTFIWGLNLLFVIIVIFSALIGFIRGTRKSIVHLIVWALLLLLGVFLVKPVVSGIITADISSLNLTINGIEIKNLLQFFEEYLIDILPEYFNEEILIKDGNTMNLVIGLTTVIGKIIFWIIWEVISVFIAAIINAIVWFFVKPKKVEIDGKKKNPKKKLSSRFGGLGLGIFRGLVCMIFICFSFAGISSIANSIEVLCKANANIEITSENEIYVNLSQSNNSKLSNLENEELFELCKGYRQTIPGTIFGLVKFGEDKVTIDEAVFDYFLSVNNKKETIKLRRELNKITEILQKEAIQTIIKNGIRLETLSKINTDELKQAIDLLSSLSTIKVVIPIGIDIITYSDILSNLLGDEFIVINQALKNNISKFNKIDYENEIKILGYALVDIVDLLNSNFEDIAKVDYLSLDINKVKTIFKELSKMELIDLVAPIAITYLLTTDTVKDTLANANCTIEDLGIKELMNEVENLFTHELLLLPDIYESLVDTGIKFKDNEIVFTDIDENEIDNFVQCLFESYIVNKAMPQVVAALYYSFLPEEYQNMISDEELKNANWKEELSSLLTAVALLMKYDIISSNNPSDVFIMLEEDDIEKLGYYLSSSNLLCGNLNKFIEVIFSSMNIDGLEIDGLSNSEQWNKSEITNLLLCIKKLVNIIVDIVDNGKTIENQTIEELANYICKSQFVKKNLNNIIKLLENRFDIELAELSNEEWDKKEIYAVSKAVTMILSTIEGNNINFEYFFNLSENELDVILESKLIKESLINLLVEKTKEGNELSNIKGVDNTETKYLWDDTIQETAYTISNSQLIFTKVEAAKKYIIYKNGMYFMSTIEDVNLNEIDNYTYNNNDEFEIFAVISFGELRKVMNAIRCLDINNIENFDIDLRNVVNNKTILLDSYIITETLADQIRKLENDSFEIPEDFKENGLGKWHNSTTENGELYNVIVALDVILGISSSSIPVLINDINVDNINLKRIIEEQDDVLNSVIITSTLIKMIKDLDNDHIIIPKEYCNDNYNIWYDAKSNTGEIKFILNAIDKILTIPDEGFNINVEDITINNLIQYSDEILKSAILTATLTGQIINLNNVITIKDDYTIGEEYSWDNDYKLWKNYYNSNYEIVEQYGELHYFINAIKELLNINESEKIKINDLNEKLDTIYIENIIDNREKILQSVIASRTIIDQIMNINKNAIAIPSNYLITDVNSYDIWMNKYINEEVVSRGELDRLLVSIYTLFNLSTTTQTSITSVNIADSINNIVLNINVDSNKEYRQKLLGSIVVSETIVTKISEFTSIQDYIKKTELNQNNLNNFISLTNENNRDDWYFVNDNGIPEEKELWNILTSVALLLRDTNTEFSNIDKFNIDNLLNSNLIIKCDTNYNVIESDIEQMLKSYIIEEIFAEITDNIFKGVLKEVIEENVINSFNYYENSVQVKNGEEYDLRTFLESYYIMNNYINYNNFTDLQIDTIDYLASDEGLSDLSNLAIAMVISRTFRNSIAKMYNFLFKAYYISKYSKLPINLPLFEQENYNNSYSKIQAHNNFVDDYHIIHKSYQI